MRAAPTLFTTASRPPPSSAAPRSTASAHPSAVPRSTATGTAPISAAASAGERAATATAAPSAISSSAVARPIPWVPPVTRTRRPFSPMSMIRTSYDHAQMTRLLLVRHGETDWNRDGRWQGHAGPGLNDLGRRQAAAVAMRIAAGPVAAVYTSDLPRAIETAEAVTEATGIPAVLDHELREVDV